MSCVELRTVTVLLSVGVLCCIPVAAQTFEVDGSGNVEATSLTGDGSGLTGLSTELQHGFVNEDCTAGTTCFLFSGCPANFEVTGGGFFINSTDDAARQAVTLHQSYRTTVTQWAIEATNGSGISLDLFVTSECARVSPAAAAKAQDQGLPSGLNMDRTLLACPQWDIARYVDRDAAESAHFCPNHGLKMKASGGGPLPIPLVPAPSVPESTESGSDSAGR